VLLAERGFEVILETAGKVEHRLFRRLAALDQRRVAGPADFHPAEQVGLGAGHAVEPARIKPGAWHRKCPVGMKADLGAAAVVDFAELFEAALRNATGEPLPVELPVACDFDHKIVGQRIHHGYADTVQAAGGLVDLAVEFAAGVQHGHDHFKGGLAGKLRMVFHRDAAAIVGDGEIAIRIKLDFDEIGMSGDGFVHRVVDDFGEKVVQRALVGAADIHARAAPHRLEALRGPRWPKRHNHRRWPALRIWTAAGWLPWLSALGWIAVCACVFSVFGSALAAWVPMEEKRSLESSILWSSLM
jgi:hypothetical protein